MKLVRAKGPYSVGLSQTFQIQLTFELTREETEDLRIGQYSIARNVGSLMHLYYWDSGLAQRSRGRTMEFVRR